MENKSKEYYNIDNLVNDDELNDNKWKIIIYSVLTVFSQSGQVIMLPIFVGSFNGANGQSINPYFVLFICSLSFAIFFMGYECVRYYRSKVSFVGTRDMHKYFILIGLFNALNGLLTVYASPDKRTPADIQGILTQITVPATFLCSRLIKKEILQKNQTIGAGVVGLGVFASLIPLIVSIAQGNDIFKLSNLLWSIVFMSGNFMSVLMNVYEDHILKKYNTNLVTTQLLAWTNLYQFIWLILLFELDIIPNFGSSSNPGEWSDNLKYGFQCMFHDCTYTFFYGLSFIAMYILTYATCAYILKHMTANYNIIINVFVSPITVTFWIIFPVLGKSVNQLTMIMDYVAVIIVAIGIYYYTKEKIFPMNSVNEDSSYNTFESDNDNDGNI